MSEKMTSEKLERIRKEVLWDYRQRVGACEDLNEIFDAAYAGLQVERLRDLVRQQRAELHRVDLISDEEYAELCADPKAVLRLTT
jgi:hypothetical protein